MPTRRSPVVTNRLSFRPVQGTAVPMPLIRQWKLLELLASAPDGITVKEFAEATGTCDKTVRRDLSLLRQVGFDLKETVGPLGRKSWRVRRPFGKVRSPRRHYKAILNLLDGLLIRVSLVGDRRLVRELRAIRCRVERKCK